MADHTPTPWKTEGVYLVAPFGPTIADCKKSPAIDVGTARTNAEFIVKAVNAHDALVKALKECAIRCRYDGDLFHDQGNEMRMNASWRAAELAEDALASIKEPA